MHPTNQTPFVNLVAALFARNDWTGFWGQHESVCGGGSFEVFPFMTPVIGQFEISVKSP